MQREKATKLSNSVRRRSERAIPAFCMEISCNSQNAEGFMALSQICNTGQPGKAANLSRIAWAVAPEDEGWDRLSRDVEEGEDRRQQDQHVGIEAEDGPQAEPSRPAEQRSRRPHERSGDPLLHRLDRVPWPGALAE